LQSYLFPNCRHRLLLLLPRLPHWQATSRLTASCLVLMLLISGCSLSQPSRPVAPVSLPATFSDSGSSPLPTHWWLTFTDPVLDTLINQALTDNLSLQSARDRLLQAEALARQSGAALYPTLDATAEVSTSRVHADGNTSTVNNKSLGLMAGYEIDLWGRLRSSRDAASLDAEASAEDLQTAAISLTADVAVTWYQLVEQSGQLALLNEQTATNEKVLDLVTLQFRTGQVGIADVLQQRQLIETNRGEKAQISARLKVLEHQLAVLLGQAPNQIQVPQQTVLAELPPLPQTGLPADLLQQRPDLRSAYNALLAADQRIAVAVADRFPQLSLSASLETSGEHTRNLFNDWLTNLSANLLGPVFDAGQRRAEVDRTRAVAAERLHDYGQAVLTALTEVEDALVQERRQREYLASLSRQLELAGQVTRSLRDRYLKGAVDYQRVLDALLSQQQLQRDLLTGQRELLENRITLCRALGGGWPLI